jgi:hypothetical protein
MPLLRLRDEISFPGGVLTVEPHGRGGALLFWVKALGIASLGSGSSTLEFPLRDLVIRDGERGRLLYREGPYTGSGVEPAVRRVVSQIEAIGLAEFLRRAHVASGTLGPIHSERGTIREFIAFCANVSGWGWTHRKRRSIGD